MKPIITSQNETKRRPWRLGPLRLTADRGKQPYPMLATPIRFWGSVVIGRRRREVIGVSPDKEVKERVGYDKPLLSVEAVVIRVGHMGRMRHKRGERRGNFRKINSPG